MHELDRSTPTDSADGREKLNFWFAWTLAHALGGGAGLFVADLVIRARLLGGYSLTAAFVIFEGLLAAAKLLVFRAHPRMKYLETMDLLTWVLAGAAVLVGSWADESGNVVDLTAVSLNLLVLYGFLANGYVLSSQLVRINNPEASRRRKERFARLKERLADPRQRLPAVLALLGLIILYLVAGLIAGALLLPVSLAIVLGPLFLLQEAFQTVAEPLRVPVFGLAGVGWLGALTGLDYLLSYRRGLEMIGAAFKGQRV